MEGEGPGLGRQAHTTPGDAGRAQDTGWAGCPLLALGREPRGVSPGGWGELSQLEDSLPSPAPALWEPPASTH